MAAHLTGSKFPPPLQLGRAQQPFGLKCVAQFLPGGLKTMIMLAGLSTDARVRDVARRWKILTNSEKADMSLERLCCGARVGDDEFLARVVVTGFELGIDVSYLIAQTEMPRMLRGTLARATKARRDIRTRLHESRSLGIGMQFAAIRGELGLSQAKFAALFLTTVRTVRRWETEHTDPTPHQQWFMELFLRYISRKGVKRFLRRFLGE